MKQGYYSLIQYCPNWTRLEVCNIGVVLLCPEAKYLDVLMVEGYTRIQSFFGKEHLHYVKAFKDHFAQGIRNEQENVVSLESLKSFISRRANYFRMTEPRSIAIEKEPKLELQNLFEDIFAGTAKPAKVQHPNTRAQLCKAIKESDVDESRIIHKVPKITVPGFPGSTITPCLGFMNGTFNLVLHRWFSPGDALNQIGRCVVIGKKLSETRNHIWGAQKLVVLACADDDVAKERINDSRLIFEQNNVGVVTSVEDVVLLLKREAQAIDKKLYAQIIATQSV